LSQALNFVLFFLPWPENFDSFLICVANDCALTSDSSLPRMKELPDEGSQQPARCTPPQLSPEAGHRQSRRTSPGKHCSIKHVRLEEDAMTRASLWPAARLQRVSGVRNTVIASVNSGATSALADLLPPASFGLPVLALVPATALQRNSGNCKRARRA
jgi:hypothetical protein